MIVVLGAGIAGLSAAYKLNKEKVLFEIYEKNSAVGGLLDCFTVQGYRFDQAVHLSFGNEKPVREVFDQTPYNVHSPEAKCFDNNIWLKHPVQNNLYPLQVNEKVKLINSFVKRPDIKFENYGQWLDYQYGYEIAKRFPRKYTIKYWDIEPEAMGVDWIGSRMHRATLEQVLEGAMSNDVPNYYYAKEMRYPKKGGYRSFLNPLLVDLKPNVNKEVICVDLEERIVFFNDGEEVKFNKLINTIPLPEFIEKVRNIPKDILSIASKLLWTKVHIVSFGFTEPDLVKDLWAYIYDEDIYASRFYSPSIKSIDNSPSGTSSIQFEIYERNNSPKKFDKKDLLENCIYALTKMKIAKKDQIAISDVRTLEYGNVIFYKEMEKDREILTNWLESKGVVLAGRFGTWDYLWSNQAMISGFDSVKDVL